MKMVLIGHRGTGKSQLLERLKVYFDDQKAVNFFDLDREIEFREGKTITQIFNEIGESSFRELEVKVFQDLLRENQEFVISVGAGFSLQEIPLDIQCLWVRRKTDSLGRVFINRPRLNPEVSPLEEYLQRLPLREERYRKHSTDEYLMAEGIRKPNPVERDIFNEKFQDLGGVITLLPHHFESVPSLQHRIRHFEVDYFELRDDLLTIRQIQTVTSLLPTNRVLVSLRTAKTHPWIQEYLRTQVLWDWALELGPCPFPPAPFYSVHQIPSHYLEDSEALQIFVARFHIPAIGHIKLSPVVENFEQLQILLSWQQQSPQNRSILPRSVDGRWSWLRLWLKGRQKINFLRLDQGSSLDQPTLYEWMCTPVRPNKFAAVLGHPVFHSRTPVEHQEYFMNKNMPVFAIDFGEEEFQMALEMLDKLGLQAAAVTSPLKGVAYRWSAERSPMATELESANTLRKNRKWTSHNTDVQGFQALFARLTGDRRSVAVWGGHGTLPGILKVCPQALCFSARTQEFKLEYGDQRQWTRDQIAAIRIEGPRILVWAATPEAQFPPQEWRPEIVVDLNYREDSLAREYALQVKAQCIDGLVMFEEQARGQREFWDR